MDRLLREGNPPAGQLASPKPQYKDVQTNNWEELKGEGGASYVKDKDVFAKLEQISKGLPVQVEQNFMQVVIETGDVGPRRDRTIDIYANPGEIWTLKRFGYYAQRAEGHEGTQAIWLYHGNTTSDDEFIMVITGNAGQFVRGTIPGRRVPGYGGTVIPEDPYEMVEALRDTTILSDALPLKIRYRNLSDTAVLSARFRLYFLVEKVNNVA